MPHKIKTIAQPSTGRSFKLGRRRPVARCPRLSLKNYLYKSLPAPPPSIDYSVKPATFLRAILGNDTLGDCTAAAAFHIGGTLLSNAGQAIPFTQDDVIKFYSATGGYIPGNPDTDQGADEQACLNYWQANGLTPGQHKITGWLSVDGSNLDEVRTAMWLFESLYFGMELPDKWINPMPSKPGFLWDVAGDPDPDNGHCVSGEGYTPIGVLIDTWGMVGVITWDAIAKYCTTAGQGELYCVLGVDAINNATQKASNGFDFTQLQADLQAIRN